MRFPFRFYRGGPTDHVVKYVAGERRAEGRGKMFLVGPRTTIVRVPTTDLTIPFTFTELTADGQEVVVQGELLAGLILEEILKRRDFSIDVASDDYTSDDPTKIEDDARHALQAYVRREVLGKSLQAALASTASIQDAVRDAIGKDAKAFTVIGVEVRNLFVTSVSPANLDLKRALEAKAREEMLADADRALAERRMDAAKSDRGLKEYEAETAEGLERRRAALVAARNANVIAEAEADATAIAKRLEPYASTDPRLVFALGIRELGASGRIGQVNFTPELLAAFQGANGAR